MRKKFPLRNREERTHNVVSIEAYDNTSNAYRPSSLEGQKLIWILFIHCNYNFHNNLFLLNIRTCRRNMGETEVKNSPDLAIHEEYRVFIDHLKLKDGYQHTLLEITDMQLIISLSG